MAATLGDSCNPRPGDSSRSFHYDWADAMDTIFRILGGTAMWAIILSNVYGLVTIALSSWTRVEYRIRRRYRVSVVALCSAPSAALVSYLVSPRLTGSPRDLGVFMALLLGGPVIPATAFVRALRHRRRLGMVD